MTWKHALISAATLANVLVIITPGAMMVWEVIGDIGLIQGSRGSLGWFVRGIVGFSMVVVGTCNVMCLQMAYFAPGSHQRRVFRLGVVSCGLMVVIVLLVMALSGRPFWYVLPGAVAILTVLAMRRVRPELPPGWQCPMCDYDLRGLSGTVCPECGAEGSDEVST